MEKRQGEFTKYMKIHVPDAIDFGDNIKEEPISNVDSLIHEKMKERSYDVFDKEEEKTNNETDISNGIKEIEVIDNELLIKEIEVVDSEPLIKETNSSHEDSNEKMKYNQIEENAIVQNLIKRIEVLEETQQEMKAHMSEIQEKMLENINANQEKKMQDIEQNIENTIENIHNNTEE